MRRTLVMALAWGLVLASCAKEQPDIALEQAEADFGVVPNGELRSVEVRVENRGGGDLRIESVTTSCGCTTASVDPQVIPAGGASVLRVDFDSGAHGPELTGSVVRQVFIASNDPDEPEVEFRIRAEVVPGS